MIGYYNYTVILTYTSLVSAVIGITFAFSGNIQGALICLMVSGFCDMFDGTVARTRKKTTKEETMFGANIDSLSDLVAFGVLPASILYGLGGDGILSKVVMCIFVLCALIRLAYFDVQETININKSKRREYFNGLPVTNVALIAPGLLAINLLLGINSVVYYMISLIIVAALYVWPFKLKKLYMPWLLIFAAGGLIIFIVICIFGGVYNT